MNPIVLPGQKARDPVLCGVVRTLELLLVILREVTRVRLVSPLHGSIIGLEVPHDDLEERRFSNSVRSHDRDPVPPVHGQVDPVQHFVVAERLPDVLDLENFAPAVPLFLEPEVRIAPGTRGQRLEGVGLLLDQAQLALCLPGLARLGPEPVHELLVMRDLPLAARDLLLAAVPFFLLAAQEVVVIAPVHGDGLVVHVQDVRGDVVEETVVVGDDDRRPREITQEFLEPANRQDIEVIRRLIEQQHVRRARQRLGEQHTQLESAGERGQGPAVNFRREPQTLEDLRGPGLRGVSVVPLDRLLEHVESLGVELGLVGFEQCLLLDHRLPELGVAHHRHPDDLLVTVEELVLPEDPEPRVLRDRHGALGRIEFATQDVEQRRLARTVRADEPVTLAPVELERRVGEQRLVAVPLAE